MTHSSRHTRTLRHSPLACGMCTGHQAGLCDMTSPAAPHKPRASQRTVLEVPAGADIVRQGEIGRNSYTVLDGWLFLYCLLQDGRRQILGFALPGDRVNLQIMPRPNAFSIQALTAATVCALPHERLVEALQRHPAAAVTILDLVTCAERIAYEHMTSLGRRTAWERTGHFLIEVYCRSRKTFPAGDAHAITMPFTQSHIADALGLTAVHVNRTLRKMVAENLIAYDHRTLRILDPDRLAEATGFDRDVSLAGPACRDGLDPR